MIVDGIISLTSGLLSEYTVGTTRGVAIYRADRHIDVRVSLIGIRVLISLSERRFIFVTTDVVAGRVDDGGGGNGRGVVEERNGRENGVGLDRRCSFVC